MAMSTAGQVILEEDQIVSESLLTTDEMEVDRPVVKHITVSPLSDQEVSAQQTKEQVEPAAA